MTYINNQTYKITSANPNSHPNNYYYDSNFDLFIRIPQHIDIKNSTPLDSNIELTDIPFLTYTKI